MPIKWLLDRRHAYKMWYGTNNEFSKLQTVVICPPINFEIVTPINIIQDKWHKLGKGPDPMRRVRQHEAFKDVLKEKGIDIWEVTPTKSFPYQVFVRDVGVVLSQGAIIGKFKFDVRKGEETEILKLFFSKGVNTMYEFDAPCIFEGGDFIFLNSSHIAVGLGDRTNNNSLVKLKELLPNVTLHPVYLPKTYVHLDVVFNVISSGLVLAYISVLSNGFIRLLKQFNFQIIEVSKEEQETMATNVLAIDDGKVISASSNRECNRNMQREGLEVIELNMSDLLMGGGGPRCITLPVNRV